MQEGKLVEDENEKNSVDDDDHINGSDDSSHHSDSIIARPVGKMAAGISGG